MAVCSEVDERHRDLAYPIRKRLHAVRTFLSIRKLAVVYHQGNSTIRSHTLYVFNRIYTIKADL